MFISADGIKGFLLAVQVPGMAIEDINEPYGVKLMIEDYPYANDGLLLWDAIGQWATSYVDHYYPQAHIVKDDEELQAWWT
ncbi:linoleate 13S-lipoxygenase 2-1, chloroplastic-like protein [Tanacetum coccineum]